MRNRTHCPTTRASLTATAAYNTRWFASLLAGTALLGASSIHAATWDGETDNNWNTLTNWDGDIGTGGTNAIININPDPLNAPPHRATIFENIVATPVDIFVGSGAGADGRLDHTAGDASTGGGNWMYVGHDGGTGLYNLADTTGAGGEFTGFAQGTGSMTVGGRLYIGGFAGSGSDGTVNVNTEGSLIVSTQLQIASNNSVGAFNLDAGAVTVGDWMEVGNGGGNNGTLNMSGGTIAKGGANGIIIGANGATGTATVTGGTITSTVTGGNGPFRVGNNPGSNGTLNLDGGEIIVDNEIYVGNNGATGTLNFSSGSISNTNWVAIGRENGSGTVDMTGGTWTKAGGGNFIVGASGPATMTQSGGLVDVQTGITWIAEGNNATATLTLSDSADFRTSVFSLGVNAGTNGTLNLDGGAVLTSQFTGGDGNATVNFDGTQITASADNGAFISNLDTAVIEDGGLLVDSNGFNLFATQGLSGTGNVVKSGDGTLTLGGANTYTGTTAINGGTLALSTASTGTGDITVASGAGFGVVQTGENETLVLNNLTFGGDGTLNVDLGDFAGNPTSPVLSVNGTTTLNGTVTVNLADASPQVGNNVPLLSFPGGTAGAGNFELGSLPLGVMATLDVSAGSVALDVNRYAILVWDGFDNSSWTGAGNWDNEVDNFSPATYVDGTPGDPVKFDDVGSGTVTLNSTVSPAAVSFTNFTQPYTLTGTGAIAGETGLVKAGDASLTIGTTNTYSGATRIEGGSIVVSTLPDAGVASPIGTGDLVLAGGTLEYTGPATTTNRGFTVAAADPSTRSGISLANDVTMSGQVTATSGKLLLSGPGVLSLTHEGPISLTNGPGDGNPPTFVVDGGGLTLAGTNQTAQIIGNTQVGVSDGSTTAFTVGGDTELTLNRFQVGFGTSTPSVLIEGDATVNKIGGSWMSIGNSNTTDATMTVRDNGTFNAGGGDFNVSDVDTSKGTLTIEDNGSVSADGTVFIGKNGGTEGTLNMDGGTFTANNWMTIGRYNGAIGVVNVDGGTINQTSLNEGIIVGENGTGTLNVNSGAVNIAGGALYMTAETTGTGDATVNLNGGTITARRVAERDFAEGNTSTFNFNGGLLVAGANSNLDYMSNLDEAFVLSGGAFIDTNGETIAIGQALLDGGGGGGLTKSGAGFLQLNGANTYTGTTTVTGGALGGDGSVAGPLVVNSGATIAPGTSVGTFSAGATTISGTYEAEIDGASADLLAVNGALNISGATLDVSQLGAPSAEALIIATYTSLNGTFAQELNLPGDYTVDYNYQGGNQIALVGTPTASAYDSWAAGFGLDPETDGAPGFDADDDGQVNLVEFALGGDPTDGADNAKVYSLTGDTDADTEDELLMTIAVLEGTEAFAGSPSPTATEQGFTYTIQGSLTLDGFPEAVTPVAPVTTGLPAAPAGYEYRTFRLDGSDGLPSQGFLRVDVSEVAAE